MKSHNDVQQEDDDDAPQHINCSSKSNWEWSAQLEFILFSVWKGNRKTKLYGDQNQWDEQQHDEDLEDHVY